MSRVSHIRIYPTDWRSGCMGLTLEQEGLYIRMCMFMAETARRVPLDDTESARMLNVQTRNYRRVLGELLRLGKITRHDNGYGNDRVEHERAEAEKASHRKPAAAAEGGSDRQANPGPERQDREATADLSPNYSGYNADLTAVAEKIPQQKQCHPIEPITNNQVDVVGERVRDASAIDWKTLKAQLIDAGGSGIADEAIAPGLANVSRPLEWLKAGCDLDLDVLPTIRAIAAKRTGRPVMTWDYFERAVADARANRERPMPRGVTRSTPSKTRPAPLTVADVLRRQIAEQAAQHAGVAS